MLGNLSRQPMSVLRDHALMEEPVSSGQGLPITSTATVEMASLVPSVNGLIRVSTEGVKT